LPYGLDCDLNSDAESVLSQSEELEKVAKKCTHNCILPVTLLNTEGQPISGTFDTPTVPDSQLPALLGLSAARESRMIIDMSKNMIYMAGAGDYDMMRALPPGTQQFSCVLAPSGHMMIPCAEFQLAADTTSRGRLKLTPQLSLPVQIVSDAQSSSAQMPRTRAVAFDAPN
jgi:hypothetical protein